MSQDDPIVFRGGARTGALTSTWPFATLHLHEEELVLRANFRTLRFSSQDSIRIRTAFHILFRFPVGIRIEHEKGDYPETVIFHYFRCARLFEQLRKSAFQPLVEEATSG